jgi:hypothetical protein
MAAVESGSRVTMWSNRQRLLHEMNARRSLCHEAVHSRITLLSALEA